MFFHVGEIQPLREHTHMFVSRDSLQMDVPHWRLGFPQGYVVTCWWFPKGRWAISTISRFLSFESNLHHSWKENIRINGY